MAKQTYPRRACRALLHRGLFALDNSTDTLRYLVGDEMKLFRGAFFGLTFELLIAAIILALVTLSCGVITPAAVSANAENLPVAGVNEKPQIDTLTQKVSICGRWNIRPEAGDLNGHKGWLEDGQIATVKLPAKDAEEMGMWYELAEGGWVNARAECEVK